MDEKEFEEIISKNKVVLVDFSASWCGPCQMMKPVVEELKEKYSKKEDVKVVEIDVDESPAIAAKFGIMGVPTFIIFKDGKEAEKQVGAIPQEMLEEKIEQLSK